MSSFKLDELFYREKNNCFAPLCLPLLWAQGHVGRAWHPSTSWFLRIASTLILKPGAVYHSRHHDAPWWPEGVAIAHSICGASCCWLHSYLFHRPATKGETMWGRDTGRWTGPGACYQGAFLDISQTLAKLFGFVCWNTNSPPRWFDFLSGSRGLRWSRCLCGGMQSICQRQSSPVNLGPAAS